MQGMLTDTAPCHELALIVQYLSTSRLYLETVIKAAGSLTASTVLFNAQVLNSLELLSQVAMPMLKQ